MDTVTEDAMRLEGPQYAAVLAELHQRIAELEGQLAKVHEWLDWLYTSFGHGSCGNLRDDELWQIIEESELRSERRAALDAAKGIGQ